jgi:hypothetical protein
LPSGTSCQRSILLLRQRETAVSLRRNPEIERPYRIGQGRFASGPTQLLIDCEQKKCLPKAGLDNSASVLSCLLMPISIANCQMVQVYDHCTCRVTVGRLLSLARRLAVILCTGSALVSCGKPVSESTPQLKATAPSPAATAPADRNYVFGEVVKCGATGHSEKFRGYGWSGPERDFTWTDGKAAQLLFDIQPSDRPLALRMRLAGVTKAPDLPFQPVEVYANGYKIAEWQVAGSADYTAEVPAAAVKQGGELKIELKIPKAASPQSLGINEDPRTLGICCWEYGISQA